MTDEPQQPASDGDDGASDEADGALDARVIHAPEVLEEQVEPLFDERAPVKVVDARVVDSIEKANIDLERARKEADAIIERAKEEAEEIRKEARAEGHEEGLEEVVDLMAEARKEYTELIEGAEDDMLELAARLARRIVGEAIELEPTRVQRMVATVLRHARGKRQITVLVSADDLEVLEESADEMSRLVDGVPVHFEADEALERGSCVIQTESGRIDGRIETQLDTLLEALRGG